ncbi:YpmS family protein [Streptococcaceae bacterium ESL0687]|nr:YpmS family protein [Streptococcaceae bacterium ESL0687]
MENKNIRKISKEKYLLLKKKKADKKSSPKAKSRNVWKYFFIVLLGLNLAGGGFLALKVFAPWSQPTITMENEGDHDLEVASRVAKVEMTSSELNHVVNYYLEKNYKSKNYNLNIADKITLTGSYQFFFAKFPLTITFVPQVLDNGNVELVVDSLTAGSLNLPKEKALTYIKESYKFPNFIVVNPSKEKITIDLSNLSLDDGFIVEASQIDLKNEKIVFDLLQK